MKTSWILTRRESGEVIGEFFNPDDVAKFDPSKVLVETAGEYLGRINAAIAQDNRFALSRSPAGKRTPYRPAERGEKQLLLLERMNDDPNQQGLFEEESDAET